MSAFPPPKSPPGPAAALKPRAVAQAATRPIGPGTAPPHLPHPPHQPPRIKSGRRPAKPKPIPWSRRLVARVRTIRPRVLPLTIFAAVLMLGVRVGDLWRLTTHDARLPEFPTSLAQAPAAPPAAAPPAATPEKPAATPEKPAEGNPAGGTAAPQSYNTAPPATDRLSPIDTELAQRYAERRAELDRRTKEVEQREALLAVAEKRIDQKVQELEKLRNDVQKMLRVGDDKQGAQVESLVKIYESMKPKEAARIFEELDMPVLVDVFQRMKEAKTAPILAAMDPAKAKALTTALMERRVMPAFASQ